MVMCAYVEYVEIAAIIEVPAAPAVAKPFPLTVATNGSEVVHDTAWLALAGRAVALSCTVWPISITVSEACIVTPGYRGSRGSVGRSLWGHHSQGPAG